MRRVPERSPAPSTPRPGSVLRPGGAALLVLFTALAGLQGCATTPPTDDGAFVHAVLPGTSPDEALELTRLALADQFWGRVHVDPEARKLKTGLVSEAGTQKAFRIRAYATIREVPGGSRVEIAVVREELQWSMTAAPRWVPRFDLDHALELVRQVRFLHLHPETIPEDLRRDRGASAPP